MELRAYREGTTHAGDDIDADDPEDAKRVLDFLYKHTTTSPRSRSLRSKRTSASNPLG